CFCRGPSGRWGKCIGTLFCPTLCTRRTSQELHSLALVTSGLSVFSMSLKKAVDKDRIVVRNVEAGSSPAVPLLEGLARTVVNGMRIDHSNCELERRKVLQILKRAEPYRRRPLGNRQLSSGDAALPALRLGGRAKPPNAPEPPLAAALTSLPP